MSAYIFYIKQNDRRPNLVVHLKNYDGTPLDLTTADSVVFTMVKNTTYIFTKVACNILDAPNGIVEYEWQDGDTSTLGTYLGEFEIAWTAGLTQTMPEDDYIKIIVKDELA